MWCTDFESTEEDDIMHGRYADFNVFPDNMYKNPPLGDIVMKEELKGIAKMTNYNPISVVNDEVKAKAGVYIESVPEKYRASKEDWYKMAEWRSMWRFEKAFEENYPVSCQLGFDTDTNEMRQNGWEITLEFNRATSKRKLCFRHKKSGLMARVPFEFSMEYIDIPMLYAVRNYKLKALEFTETIVQLTEDMIPDILDWIREVKKANVSEYVWEQKKKEAAEKVIELGNYLHNQKAA